MKRVFVCITAVFLLLCVGCKTIDGTSSIIEELTNIVEDIKQYNVVYFLKTTGKYSYIKFYFDKNMFVTYGHPYSDIEAGDVLLNEIIKKLS